MADDTHRADFSYRALTPEEAAARARADWVEESAAMAERFLAQLIAAQPHIAIQADGPDLLAERAWQFAAAFCAEGLRREDRDAA